MNASSNVDEDSVSGRPYCCITELPVIDRDVYKGFESTAIKYDVSAVVFSGFHCEISSVSKVSVKAGESITIPCRYELRYRDHVKYLCKGTYWTSCSIVVKTNQPHHSRIFSISDDTKETIFTVTICDVTEKDTYYWCAVEIDVWPDVKQRFQLSVTPGMPSLYVDHQEITAFERGNVTVMCHYEYPKSPSVCSLSTKVTIVIATLVLTLLIVSAVFFGWKVMRRDKTKPEGPDITECRGPHCFVWDMAVHLVILLILTGLSGIYSLTTVRKVSVKAGGSITIPCLYESCTDLKSFIIISLSLLTCVVILTVFLCFLLKKHKQTEAAAGPPMTECRGPHCFVWDMAVQFVILLILTGLSGIYSVTTVSQVSVKAGGSITIPCLYESWYIKNVKYLCKGGHWNSCSKEIKTNQPNSGKFSISDDKSRRIFTVTIKDLTDTDTGYYWCALEIDGGSDAGQYFYLSVTRGAPSLSVSPQEVRGFEGEMININCPRLSPNNSGKMEWCKLGSSCVTVWSSGSIDGATVTIKSTVHNIFTVTMSGLRIESSGWYWCDDGGQQMPVHVTITERPTTSEYNSYHFVKYNCLQII
ncbi:hypothetical protein L3Q82_011890 [Scortum barcoo]|uniref:Uncharacterized protein n=1 Tax=Scortum barcoo TaxID=214431 RepID=A0ACB8W7Q8_9TELE|nr:hypothetical protein L3Q82_011890 [Scortum barcoo]